MNDGNYKNIWRAHKNCFFRLFYEIIDVETG
jgi:hypothetical protein